MNAARCYFLSLIVAGGVSACSAAEDYYHTYLSLLGTNITRNVLVDSPLLIDTNNSAPKLATSVIDLAETVTNCQIGQVRLGMTMEEVVAGWGKPRGIWPSCFGGARFIYWDVATQLSVSIALLIPVCLVLRAGCLRHRNSRSLFAFSAPRLPSTGPITTPGPRSNWFTLNPPPRSDSGITMASWTHCAWTDPESNILMGRWFLCVWTVAQKKMTGGRSEEAY
jgi:hypothetical protein